MIREFLPISRDDMKKRGWDELDFVYVIGDAYVDHPSFGAAVIGRTLEAMGLRVAIVPQPDWRGDYRDCAETGISCQCRQYGFHGESLYGFKEKASSGRLYTGGRLRQKTGLCSGCLW